MRHIATVATDNCRRGLSILVASLRAHGWTDPVRVYVPEGDPLPELPGTTLVHRHAWWTELPHLAECRNAAALLKAEILYDPLWQAGDTVLYLDGADTCLAADPANLFDLFEQATGSPFLAAAPFRVETLVKHNQMGLLPKLHLVRFFADICRPKMNYCNNGVWVFRAGAEAILVGRLWQALELSEAASGVVNTGFHRPEDNLLVGDQQTFNMIWRMLHGTGRTLDLPLWWNFRGGYRLPMCEIRDGQIWHPYCDAPLALIHSSGPHNLPDFIVEHVTRGSDLPIVPGGTGLAGERPRDYGEQRRAWLESAGAVPFRTRRPLKKPRAYREGNQL